MRDELAESRTEYFKKTGEMASDYDILTKFLKKTDSEAKEILNNMSQKSESMLLSIKEAAKLMGVCENTLRDWDTSGKFVAERTEGLHRRYSLEKIRDYIDAQEKEKIAKNELEKLNSNKLKINNVIQTLIETYKLLLEDVPPEEHGILAILLENCSKYNRMYFDKKALVFTNEQILTLVKKAWMKLRFKKMVSIQPLMTPAGLCYHLNGNNIVEEAVCASTRKYNFNIFAKADFESIVDLYAGAIASEIDLEIINKLPQTKIDYLKNTEVCLQDAKSIYDYIIAPESVINEISKLKAFRKIDFYPIIEMMNKDLELVVVAGKYNTMLSKPIYCPYVLFLESGVATTTATGEISEPMLRYTWLE